MINFIVSIVFSNIKRNQIFIVFLKYKSHIHNIFILYMVLGFLLYEAVDLGVNVAKLTYNGARGVYYWWYAMDYPEVEREKRALEDMELLTKRIEELEKTLKEKND
ncbi:MAG: hypothetical protein ACXADW_04065 [Candidatus Hodarchaeales archaeon]